MYRTLPAAILLLSLSAPAAASIPEPLRAMLEAAIADGKTGEISTVAKFAKRTAPDSAVEIDAMVAAFRKDQKLAQQAKLDSAGLLDLWDGQADLGGSRSTGNTDTFGLTAGFDLHREGLEWRHKLKARGDYQESNGVKTREALLVSYEPSYKVDDRLSVYGLAQFERDTFLGFSRRMSLSGGFGYRAVAQPDLTIDLNAGPAFRATRYVRGDEDDTIAGRGSVALRWELTPRLKFTNDTAAYVEASNSTIATTSAVDTKIVGALSARFSYNVRYESNPQAGREPLDTLTRASLVYDF